MGKLTLLWQRILHALAFTDLAWQRDSFGEGRTAKGLATMRGKQS